MPSMSALSAWPTPDPARHSLGSSQNATSAPRGALRMTYRKAR